MSRADFREGQNAAGALVIRLAAGLSSTHQAEAIHEALLSQINIPLGWNNLEPTRDRLAGFVQMLYSPVAQRALNLRAPAKQQARRIGKRGCK